MRYTTCVLSSELNVMVVAGYKLIDREYVYMNLLIGSKIYMAKMITLALGFMRCVLSTLDI